MARALHLLQPRLPAASATNTRQTATVLFWIGVFAILLQFFLPYVVMQAMGIDPDKVKLHPAVLLVLAVGAYALIRGVVPFHQRARETPGLMLFVFGMPVLTAYAIYFTGFSGSATFPETFWSAGMLALLLETATPHQKRLLGGIMIAVCVLNVFIAIHESLIQQNWFPLVFDPDAPRQAAQAATDDFRAHAFYPHPLTASVITAMAIFLLYAMRLPYLWSAPIFCLLLIGLFAFGGRTALAVTLGVSAITAFVQLISGVVRRNLKLSFVVTLMTAAIAVPILIAVIITRTDIANRITDTLYYDGSAQARATQWEVFHYFSLRDWLFGISHDNLNVLKYQIGLGGKETDIENFWLLILFDLGGIGYFVFLLAFGAFLLHLGRTGRSPYGWLLVISALAIDSTSNSLGVKSSDLFLEVGFMVAVSGYAEYERVPRILAQRVRDRMTGPERPATALGSVIAPSRGLRLLRSRLS